MKRPRRGGILLHPTSLPSAAGIGDFGNEAFCFIDFLKQSGNKLWQVLPLNPTGYLRELYKTAKEIPASDFRQQCKHRSQSDREDCTTIGKFRSGMSLRYFSDISVIYKILWRCVPDSRILRNEAKKIFSFNQLQKERPRAGVRTITACRACPTISTSTFLVSSARGLLARTRCECRAYLRRCQAYVKAQAVHGRHCGFLRLDSSKGSGQENQTILVIGIHVLDDLAGRAGQRIGLRLLVV